MVNDIEPIDPLSEWVKFADDIQLAVPVYDYSATHGISLIRDLCTTY